MAKKTIAILELPGKGAFAPDKFGSRYGNFMKTRIPGEVNPTWIWGPKMFDLNKPADIEEFNAVCAETIPHCHRRKMRVVPRIVVIEVASKPRKPRKTNEKPPASQNANTGEPAAPTPKPPALVGPPSGGS